MTYNTCVSSVREESLATIIQELHPDVVALQECRADSYRELFREWHVCRDGQLLLAARFPITIQRTESSIHPPHTSPRATLLECVGEFQGKTVSICTVHLPSPRYGLSQVADRFTIIGPSRRGLLESETINRDSVSSTTARIAASGTGDRIVMGDFNMPIDSTLYRRDWAGYANAFTSTGWGFGFTMRPSIRGFSFGIRIDHVLAAGSWTPALCWVGPDAGSDHLPLIADLVWHGPKQSSRVDHDGEALVSNVSSAVADKNDSSELPFKPKPVVRTWKSTNGYSVEAELVGVVNGNVRLKNVDGKRLIVSLNKLSSEDQEYIRNRHQE